VTIFSNFCFIAYAADLISMLRYLSRPSLFILVQCLCVSAEPKGSSVALLTTFVQLGFSSDGVRDDKKVQFSTDLLKQRHRFLYRK